jgi:hypothetical protein
VENEILVKREVKVRENRKRHTDCGKRWAAKSGDTSNIGDEQQLDDLE